MATAESSNSSLKESQETFSFFMRLSNFARFQLDEILPNIISKSNYVIPKGVGEECNELLTSVKKFIEKVEFVNNFQDHPIVGALEELWRDVFFEMYSNFNPSTGCPSRQGLYCGLCNYHSFSITEWNDHLQSDKIHLEREELAVADNNIVSRTSCEICGIVLYSEKLHLELILDSEEHKNLDEKVKKNSVEKSLSSRSSSVLTNVDIDYTPLERSFHQVSKSNLIEFSQGNDNAPTSSKPNNEKDKALSNPSNNKTNKEKNKKIEAENSKNPSQPSQTMKKSKTPALKELWKDVFFKMYSSFNSSTECNSRKGLYCGLCNYYTFSTTEWKDHFQNDKIHLEREELAIDDYNIVSNTSCEICGIVLYSEQLHLELILDSEEHKNLDEKVTKNSIEEPLSSRSSSISTNVDINNCTPLERSFHQVSKSNLIECSQGNDKVPKSGKPNNEKDKASSVPSKKKKSKTPALKELWKGVFFEMYSSTECNSRKGLYCGLCDYFSFSITEWNDHLQRDKIHLEREELAVADNNIVSRTSCKICGIVLYSEKLHLELILDSEEHKNLDEKVKKNSVEKTLSSRSSSFLTNVDIDYTPLERSFHQVSKSNLIECSQGNDNAPTSSKPNNEKDKASSVPTKQKKKKKSKTPALKELWKGVFFEMYSSTECNSRKGLYCGLCDYFSFSITEWNDHLQRDKIHLEREELAVADNNIVSRTSCKICGIVLYSEKLHLELILDSEEHKNLDEKVKKNSVEKTLSSRSSSVLTNVDIDYTPLERSFHQVSKSNLIECSQGNDNAPTSSKPNNEKDKASSVPTKQKKKKKSKTPALKELWKVVFFEMYSSTECDSRKGLYCGLCDYFSFSITEWNDHLQRDKIHLERMSSAVVDQVIGSSCEICGVIILSEKFHFDLILNSEEHKNLDKKMKITKTVSSRSSSISTINDDYTSSECSSQIRKSSLTESSTRNDNVPSSINPKNEKEKSKIKKLVVQNSTNPSQPSQSQKDSKTHVNTTKFEEVCNKLRNNKWTEGHYCRPCDVTFSKKKKFRMHFTYINHQNDKEIFGCQHCYCSFNVPKEIVSEYLNIHYKICHPNINLPDHEICSLSLDDCDVNQICESSNDSVKSKNAAVPQKQVHNTPEKVKVQSVYDEPQIDSGTNLKLNPKFFELLNAKKMYYDKTKILTFKGLCIKCDIGFTEQFSWWSHCESHKIDDDEKIEECPCNFGFIGKKSIIEVYLSDPHHISFEKYALVRKK